MPVPSKAEAERVDISETEPLKDECQHFLDCMSNGSKPVTDGLEGLKVLKVLNVSQTSLNHHGRKVSFSMNRVEARHKGLLSAQASQPSAEEEEIFIHPTAVIDDNVTIGKNSKIWHFSHILSGSTLGERSNIGQNVVIGPEVSIGRQRWPM